MIFTRFTPHKTTLILNAKLVTYKLQQIAIAKRPDFFYNKRKELKMAHKKLNTQRSIKTDYFALYLIRNQNYCLYITLSMTAITQTKTI